MHTKENWFLFLLHGVVEFMHDLRSTFPTPVYKALTSFPTALAGRVTHSVVSVRPISFYPVFQINSLFTLGFFFAIVWLVSRSRAKVEDRVRVSNVEQSVAFMESFPSLPLMRYIIRERPRSGLFIMQRQKPGKKLPSTEDRGRTVRPRYFAITTFGSGRWHRLPSCLIGQ